MKRIINILLALVMMFSVCINVSAATTAEGRSAVLTGIMMSKEEFRDTYATSEKVCINKNDFANCYLEMSGFEKMSETLKFDARLLSDNGVETDSLGKKDVTAMIKDTNGDIADALKSQHKLTVDKKKIQLDNPIKSTGEMSVNVKLYSEVSAQLKVTIVAE